jgi:RNA polymerase sigma-70 factor (ECF subfamily)
MERVRAFESDAWERLCQIYGPLVFQWARRAGLSEDDAADVMQETFQTVARRVATFQNDGEGSTFRGWLRVISRNKIGDLYRKRAAEPRALGGTAAHQALQALIDPLGDEDHDPSAADDVLGIAQRALLLIRSEFETHTWEAFRLCVIENRSTHAVAAELQMTPKAVRQAKYRVLKRLRQELVDEFA